MAVTKSEVILNIDIASLLTESQCQQMHKEASNKFSYLLEKLEDSTLKSLTAKGSVWLQSEDQVPEVPCKESVIVQAAIAHLGEQNIQSALEILQQIDSEGECYTLFISSNNNRNLQAELCKSYEVILGKKSRFVSA